MSSSTNLMEPPVFGYYYDLLYLCCQHSREAVMQRRYSSAQGLFQTAMSYFEKAQQVAERHFEDAYSEKLLQMRHELNDCCLIVYPLETSYGMGWPQSNGQEG